MKILNVETGRWVDEDGVVGTRIRLKEFESKVTEPPVTLLPTLLSGKGGVAKKKGGGKESHSVSFKRTAKKVKNAVSFCRGAKESLKSGLGSRNNSSASSVSSTGLSQPFSRMTLRSRSNSRTSSRASSDDQATPYELSGI